MLQSLEFKAFDLLMQLRPPEPQDSRILVVEITNENSKKYHSVNWLSARSLGLGCDSDGIDRFHQEWRRSH